ncbi:MAG: SUF system Fe-S cluster assembly regulator [Rhodovarius sp.]|nr:SUF system Fe-S cluster assembly regulator [Rhodovarius sp.]MDW8313970.1 SUF system Fe-S cluster assembly regulator [Rhodovarius sp.]
MLRLSKLTDYGVVVLTRLAAGSQAGRVVAVPELAQATGLQEPTVAKVLKILGQAGMVEGMRGARGGYRLTRPLDAIPLSEVIIAFEGPIALTACVEGSAASCESSGLCPVHGRWEPVNRAVRATLERITVADLVAPEPIASYRQNALTL